MRKSLTILAALILAAAVVLSVGLHSISDARDQIVVTQTTLQGDLSAAEGLQVRTVLNEDRQLYWSTDFAATAAERAETEFRYYQSRQDTGPEKLQLDATLEIAGLNFGMGGVIHFDESEDYGIRYDRMRPAEDVASRTKPGESRTETLLLQDYYEYYPVSLHTNWLDQWSYDGFQRAQDEKFADYFRILLPEDKWVTVTVEKDDAGQVVNIDCYEDWPEEVPPDYEAPYTFAYTVATEEAIYLLLSGNEDYSHVRGGFGLYKIPVAEVSSWAGETFRFPLQALDLDHIENIYPLDPAKKNCLQRGMDDEELLLFEETDAGMLMHVMDLKTCQIRQTLEVALASNPAVWFHEDLMIMADRNYGVEENWLWVFEKHDGLYTQWLDCPFYPLNDEGMYYQNLTFAFDGEKLAMADFQITYCGASPRIAVYDKTGLLYAGDYAYSSDQMTEPLNTFNWSEPPLQLSWNK